MVQRQRTVRRLRRGRRGRGRSASCFRSPTPVTFRCLWDELPGEASRWPPKRIVDTLLKAGWAERKKAIYFVSKANRSAPYQRPRQEAAGKKKLHAQVQLCGKQTAQPHVVAAASQASQPALAESSLWTGKAASGHATTRVRSPRAGKYVERV
jgi:hypothetical protein